MCVFYDTSFMIPHIQFGTLGGKAQTSMYKNFHFIFVSIYKWCLEPIVGLKKQFPHIKVFITSSKTS